MLPYHKQKLLKQLARFKLDLLYCSQEQAGTNPLLIIDRNLTSIEKQLKKL